MHRFTALLSALVAGLFCILCSDPASADRRVALIIGNADYLRTAKLVNPANDAPDLAAALRDLSFEVIQRNDLDKRGIETALAEFERKAVGADAALFFFAGHGLQYQGRNYLLPIDADLEDDVSLRYNTLSVDTVRAALARASGVKILILDACRNNPLNDKLVRSAGLSRDVATSRGLARIDRAEGMVVAFATQADQVAQDGIGRNSPFTGALVRRLREPNLEIASLFRRVSQDVYDQTGGRQYPELSISLLQDFYLNRKDDDSKAWRRLSEDAGPEELREFMSRFPDSPYVREARSKLAVLEMLRRERDERLAMEKRLAMIEAERKEEDRRRELEALQAESRVVERAAEERRQTEQQAAAARVKVLAETQAKAAADSQSLAAARTCEAEGRDLAGLTDADVAGLRQFLAQATCGSMKSLAATRIEKAEAVVARTEQVCAAEGDRLTALRVGPDQRLALARFQKSLSCERLRPDVSAAITAIEVRLKAEEADQVARVKLAQLELGRLGCYVADADGKFDKATKTAIAAYLKATGSLQAEVAITTEFLDQLRDRPDETVCRKTAPVIAVVPHKPRDRSDDEPVVRARVHAARPVSNGRREPSGPSRPAGPIAEAHPKIIMNGIGN